MAGNLRRLAIALSKLPVHPQQSPDLEQYVTEGDFAAKWISAIIQAGDLDETSSVVDLGAGNGILGIGCTLATGAKSTLIEIDAEACEAARKGVSEHELEELCEVIQSDLPPLKTFSKIPCDLIIMNPPWGFQTSRADRPFLDLAFSSRARVIHLLHSAKATHPQAMARDAGWESEVFLQGTFRLPATYGFHDKRMSETPVICWRFTR